MSAEKDTIAYGHEGHAEFNKRFEPKPLNYDVVTAPWLSSETMARLPPVRREFDLNRDPMLADQLKDLELSEADRRRAQTEQSGRSGKKDQPKLELKPPRTPAPKMSSPSPVPDLIAAQKEEQWLAAERDFVMANIPSARTPSDQEPDRSLTQIHRNLGPER